MKNIFKIIPLVVIMLFITACGQQEVEPENTEIKMSEDMMEQYFTEMNTFSGEENFVFSPISLNSALDMYKYVGDGKKSESKINRFLRDRDYLAYEFDTKSYTSTNRIWVNKNSRVKTDSEVAEFVYEMDMSDSVKATKEKDDFVSEHTNGFIKKTPTVFDSGTVYDIMNVTYFKDAWAEGELSESQENFDFKNADGTVKSTKMLQYETDYYFENDTAYGVPVAYENGCSMILILPKTDFGEMSLLGLMDGKTFGRVSIRFPEFVTESQFEMTDFFDNVGISLAGEGISMSQIAKIKVDKMGTEAAAVTEMLKMTAMPVEDEFLVLTYDRPFCYAIYDNVNEDIAFMGKIMKLD